MLWRENDYNMKEHDINAIVDILYIYMSEMAETQ